MDAREPHARGDGPTGDSAWPRACQRAPRTWGWTGSGLRGVGDEEESPTHVGMDLWVYLGKRHAGREPHARGDGPQQAITPHERRTRAPRTWGWTVRTIAAASPVWESPTHVGMDLGSGRPRGGHGREPHARGDGPPAPIGVLVEHGRAPRTWGWTAWFQWAHAEDLESPTHVGMDRCCGVLRALLWREPHARGDGPIAPLLYSAENARAPRTWGWTGRRGCVDRWRWESPTHVGMDRGGGGSLSVRIREPHARGDGPHSPTPAEPPSTRAPRTWGWTALAAIQRQRSTESPTHVGMDRLVVDHGKNPR